ncbi:lactonase [Caballeronia arationis]|jgi:pimeloyl-ACP methyl ester carboxylesterase|uniref:Lactonase n=1 Tax=Caballeronia arationis TaxID=1777142 RepID=A0A7Z7I6B5_9BURK|nr:alpha/beta hydrolase [Caballeronia arationis]SAK91264.1 lactonase [Caballeronia arationis]SOE60356.1 hypothetical protein SAMN05446927_1919 [Caballeronia arationis]
MTDFVTLPATVSRDSVTVEYEWLASEGRDAPVVVFLHEGGAPAASGEAPDDWPMALGRALTRALGMRGLVHSRPGSGWPATLRAHPHPWPIDLLRQQACDILPGLLDALDIDPAHRRRMWIVGARDGATIALLYAIAYPEALAGVALIAPQVFAEPARTEDLLGARATFETTNLHKRLGRFHGDAVATHDAPPAQTPPEPSLVNWNLEGELDAIRCPVLALPANADEDECFARHLDALRLHATRARPLEIPPAPPADRDALIDTIVRFIERCTPLSQN